MAVNRELIWVGPAEEARSRVIHVAFDLNWELIHRIRNENKQLPASIATRKKGPQMVIHVISIEMLIVLKKKSEFDIKNYKHEYRPAGEEQDKYTHVLLSWMIDMISVWMMNSLNTIQIKYSKVGVSIATCRRGTRWSTLLCFFHGLHCICVDYNYFNQNIN